MYYNLKRYNNLYGKMLYFGSGAEYDKSKDISFVTEAEFINNVPLTQYGLAKYIIGKDIEKSSNIYNLRILVYLANMKLAHNIYFWRLL